MTAWTQLRRWCSEQPATKSPGMSEHSVADAAPQLASLIDRALAGEEIVITREGRPAVALLPIAMPSASPGQMTDADFEWLRSVRVGSVMSDVPAGKFVGQMRDEENSK